MSTPLLQRFPSLASQPPEFLKDLLSSPELTEAFLFTLPEVQELAAEVEKLGKENEELAKRNIDLRDELFALRDATAQSYAHAEGLKSRWADIEKAQGNLYNRYRPSFLHMRLRHSLTAQDDESERIASAFVEARAGSALGGGQYSASGAASRTDSPVSGEPSTPVGERNQNRTVDEFIQEFKAARKTYHKRAIWTERWSRGEVAWRDD